MPNIDLKTAVARIRQIVEQRKERNQLSPFFFIVGAGISDPEIPLASKIEEHCRLEAEKYGRTSPPPSNASIDSYSHWMSEAFPSAEERQEYLRGLMNSKPISKANLRLAHLLLDHKIAQTVFTPNFDDMLVKALQLFGERPIVCDHPLTVNRMKTDSGDIQVIHVHGSYWFYDCCNLRPDISERSENRQMSTMLYESLRTHSPIVIGYSGWEGDILMAAIKRRLESGRLGTPIFWFCYHRDSLRSLPLWITSDKDIYFVLPDEPAPPVKSNQDSQLALPASQFPENTAEAEKSGKSPAESKDNVLPAVRVFDSLVREFDPPAPPLTDNPLRFYAAYLKSLLGTKNSEEAELDTYYSFHTVIGRVERAAENEKSKGPDRLQSIRDAMSKADYRNAIILADSTDLHALSHQECNEVVFVLFDACLELNDNSVEEINGYNLIVRTGDLLEREGTPDLRVQEQVAGALLNKGITLGSLDRSEEELATYDDILRRFSDAQKPDLQDAVAKALFYKGVTLGNLGRSEEEMAAYDEIVHRFADAKELPIRELVAKALFNKGIALGLLKKNEESIAHHDEVARRFADAQEPSLRVTVAKALFSKALRLGNLGRSEEAITVYGEIVRRFGDAKESALRERVAAALLNQGYRLGTLNQNLEKIAIYEDFLRRFTEATEPEIQKLMARVLFYRGTTYESLNNLESAAKSFKEVVSRFNSSSDTSIQDFVKKARRKLRLRPLDSGTPD